MTPLVERLYAKVGGKRDGFIWFSVDSPEKFADELDSVSDYAGKRMEHPLPFEAMALCLTAEGKDFVAFVRQRDKYTYLNIPDEDGGERAFLRLSVDKDSKLVTDYPPDSKIDFSNERYKKATTYLLWWVMLCIHAIESRRIPGARPEVNPEYRKTLKYKMRKQRGQPMPLEHISWNTVELPAPVYAPKPHQGGTHASPRAHDRRGHFRTYASGKRVWVRNARVGDAALGIVLKDYEVK